MGVYSNDLDAKWKFWLRFISVLACQFPQRLVSMVLQFPFELGRRSQEMNEGSEK